MNMLLLTGVVGALALGYAAFASGKIGAFKVEHARVNELSGIIQGGAMAFLYREYKALVPFVIVVGALLAWKINPQSAVCFVCGAVCSALTGYVGMRVATKSNGKTAFAATHGMNDRAQNSLHRRQRHGNDSRRRRPPRRSSHVLHLQRRQHSHSLRLRSQLHSPLRPSRRRHLHQSRRRRSRTS